MNRFFIVLLFSFFSNGLFSQEVTRSLADEDWEFKNSEKENWLTAEVPGTVHTDLMNNDEIPDPFLDKNEDEVQWVEKEDWDYRTSFELSAEELEYQNIDLVFDGLDTYAEIVLNGKEILSTDNMFRPWMVPVKDHLKEGENELLIRFKSSVNKGSELAKEVPFETPETPRAFVRKAQYQFGWDWGPRLVTSGIWKDVKLRFWNDARLEHVQIHQKTLNKEKSDLDFNIEVLVDQAGSYEFEIDGNKKKELHLKEGVNQIDIDYTVENPEFWQPNGWGKPTLYYFPVKLSKDKSEISNDTIRHGFRTVELVQEEDEEGRSFYFKVNGKPLFIKGTNWIPGDSFLPRVSKGKYHSLMQEAEDAHMNMIRIWGGGAYEDDEFYKASDENGILVWQDFMFAGSFYPSDKAFLDNVKQEVEYQAKRLQKYPSVAIYCGNNEIDEAIVNWGYQKQFGYSKEDSLQVWEDYRTIFHELIPNTLEEVLPEDDNIYWPSSPELGWGHKESLQQGDSHYWGVWHGGEPLEAYNDKVGRFMSEYGFQGMPSIEAVEAMFSDGPELSMDNPVIKHHQKHGRGWETIAEYMERDYVVPEDFEHYAYVSQLLQARGMRIAIEAHRRNQPYNMGTLIWQLNDVWPVTSWSGIDYLGNRKALQYQTKRSYEPQVVLAYEAKDSLEFFAVNDDLKRFEDLEFEAYLMNFKGKVLNAVEGVQSEEALDDILTIYTTAVSELIPEGTRTSEVFLNFKLKDKKGEVLAENNHFFKPPKHLNLPKPIIEIQKTGDKQIEISTDVLAKDVYLKGNLNYSANYFDLLPGEKRTIELSKPMDDVEVLSLWDTMQ